MTIQNWDYVIYNGEKFELLAWQGSNFPSPEFFGMKKLFAIHTACYRGNEMILRCEKNQLFLDQLYVNSHVAPKINGVEPINSDWIRLTEQYREKKITVEEYVKQTRKNIPPNASFFILYYQNLHFKTSFSGHLLMCKWGSMKKGENFIYPSIVKGPLLDLKYETGNLIREMDLTPQIQKISNFNGDTIRISNIDNAQELLSWIKPINKPSQIHSPFLDRLLSKNL